ncbi:Adenylate kinase [Devosia lucknowensis]|uniref:Adenylate kinase n=1 Tax=Devosia lucknowensis TaxID=1096929 RepID=A0A1Y6ETA3_9HYPH|nr:hypothetical protein [Devosia lucknowensis]SMQ65526.1 Adenylate kinase [Devosia lucknowensis]
MSNIPPLATLGRRILICGPSNAGKSTLAIALAQELEVPAVHLDLLHHLPNTDWQPRPRHDFHALHAQAVAEDGWVIEGNYFALLQERLDRATGVILLGTRRVPALFRYLRRTVGGGPRAGHLEGAVDRLNANMLRFILIEQPRKRDRDRALLRAAGLPMVETAGMTDLRKLYTVWSLPPPA